MILHVVIACLLTKSHPQISFYRHRVHSLPPPRRDANASQIFLSTNRRAHPGRTGDGHPGRPRLRGLHERLHPFLHGQVRLGLLLWNRDGATKTGSMWNVRFFILLSIFDRRWDPIGQYHSVNIPLGVPELVSLGSCATFRIDTLPV